MSTDNHDAMLMSLRELSETLKQRGVIDRSRRTLYDWATHGLVIEGQVIRLRTQKLGRNRYSSVLWFQEFLATEIPENV